MRFRYLLFFVSLLSLVGWGPFLLTSANYQQVPGSENWISQEVQAISAKASNLDKNVLKLSLMAYQKAQQQGITQKGILTVIDYSRPSTEKRLWVIDVVNNKVLFNTYVAHGKNSGELNSTSFSNKPNSLKSSFGVFVTDTTYTGHDGYSLHIRGLEHGINDNVYSRSVIFHGAAYVSEAYARARGMMGRSWGCMAVGFDVIHPLINTIKDKTLVFAYYPDQNWLKTSKFLA